MFDSQVNPSKIYIGNLPYKISEQELLEVCQEYGEVKSLAIVTDRMTGRSKGFAFAEYATEQEAQDAIAGMAEREVMERKLFVKVARPKASSSDRPNRSDRYDRRDRRDRRDY